MAKNKPESAEPVVPPPSRRAWWLAYYQPQWLSLAALLAVLYICLPQIKSCLPKLAERPEYLVNPDGIHVTPPPRWVPAGLVEQALRRSDLTPPFNLLTPHLAEDLAGAFARHPWVAKVERVRGVFPSQVEVTLVYRQPVAMVRVGRGVYPVDADAILLPPEDFSPSEIQRYPLIEGIRSVPRGAAGTPWADPLVVSSGRLAQTLSSHWAELHLDSVVAPRVTAAELDSPQAIFVLRSKGSRILWGRAPGIDDPAEPTTEQKIGRLQKYIRDFGGFDLPRGPYEIDIRHFREISRTPLANVPESAGRNSRNGVR